MRILILLILMACSSMVKGRERDKSEEQKCEALHGQCISKSKTCHSTNIIHNSDCSSDKKCCAWPTAKTVEERQSKCKARRKCNNKGGECKKQCDELEKITKGCLKKKGCKCCVPKCKAKKKCTEAGGYCVKDATECRGTLSKDCKGKGCHCCIVDTNCASNTTGSQNGRSCIQVFDCEWNVGWPFPYPQFPPIIVILSNPNRMVLPDVINGPRQARVPVGSNLLIACSGSHFIHFDQEPYIEATCNANMRLQVGEVEYENIVQMGCQSRVESSVQRGLFQCGFDNRAEQYNIGFMVSEETFYPLIEVCFLRYPIERTTLWTSHTIHGHNLQARLTNIEGHPWFYKPNFYSPRIGEHLGYIYTSDGQLELFSRLQIVEPILSAPHNMFARGHLARRTDFPTQAESDATMNYINALPQWATFNSGNWARMEEWVIRLAKRLDNRNGADLRISTGGLSTLYLNSDENPQQSKPLYLGEAVVVNSREVTVPALLWKVVQYDAANQAIAFVGTNNPLNCDLRGLCNDVCNQIRGLEFTAGNGAMICCHAQELYNNIPHNDMPEVFYNDLLNMP